MDREARIVLVGSTGLVGSSILRQLVAAAYANIMAPSHADLDLTSQAQTRAFFQDVAPDAVIIAAARVGGIMANWKYPYEFIQQNLAIELNTIHEAYKAGVSRLIFLGSSCIYPRMAPQPLKEEYLLTGPLEETNRPYAVAKIAGIELCHDLNREYGIHCLSLMPTNLYGPGDNFDLETSHLLPALIRKFHEAKVSGSSSVTLWGTGTPRREMLYVDDLASAVATFLDLDDDVWKEVPDGLVNVGTGQDATIAEIADVVRQVVGYEGTIVWDTEKPDGTPQKLLDVSRAMALGWRPRVTLVEGVRRAYKWYLENNTGEGRSS